MRHFLLSIFILFTAVAGVAQVNLVPNPSFEDTISCPQAPDELIKSSGWSSYGGSPDFFFDNCPMSVPYNWGGYQLASSGMGYSALATFSSSSLNMREYIGCNLTSQLITGNKYFISFMINLSLGYSTDGNCASNNFGAMFSTVPYNTSNPAPITNNPAFFSDSIITDTASWVRVMGSFVADSAYSYIILGNFFDDFTTDTTKFYSTFNDVSYYYIDDICLSTDSLFTANYNYIEDDARNIFFVNVFPNPTFDKINVSCQYTPYDLEIIDCFAQLKVAYKSIYNNAISIELNQFVSGMYFVKFRNGPNEFIKKIIKL